MLGCGARGDNRTQSFRPNLKHHLSRLLDFGLPEGPEHHGRARGLLQHLVRMDTQRLFPG